MLKRVAKVRARLRSVVLKNAGFCPICERDTAFISHDSWLQDHYKCVRCGSIPRERALILDIQQRFPNWREPTIHESSPENSGASKRFAAECRAYIATHFFPGSPPGAMVNEYRCENFEELSFGDLQVTHDFSSTCYDQRADFEGTAERGPRRSRRKRSDRIPVAD